VGFFALLSPLISVGAHWPAVGYPALMLAAVAALCDPPRAAGPSLRGRFARAGIGLSLVLVLAAHCVPVVVSVLPPVLQIGSRSVSLTTSRLYEELQGWEELGQAVVETVAAMPDPGRTFVVTRSYRLASQIRFLSGSAVATRTTGHADSHQYLIWNRQSDLSGWDALFIDKNDRERYREELQGLFERVGPFETIIVRHGGDVVRRFYLVRCYGLRTNAFGGDA